MKKSKSCSSSELLARYSSGERDFSEVNLNLVLPGVCLRESNFGGASLYEVNLIGADLSSCSLFEADLCHALLCETTLVNADLTFAELTGADFRGANLQGAGLYEAKLYDVDFRGANLDGVCFANSYASRDGDGLLPRNVIGAIVDVETYTKSKWTPELLVAWRTAGAQIDDIARFPADVRRLLTDREGLTLQFSTRITSFDRFLLEGVIFTVLGTDTDCRVTFFEEHDHKATVRLSGVPDDLEKVGNVLWDRVWEEIESRKQENVEAMAQLMTKNLRQQLSELRDSLVSIVLRVLDEQRQGFADICGLHPSPEVREMQEDQAATHIQRKDILISKTWGQKAVDRGLDHAKKKLVGLVDDALGLK